GYYKVVLDKYNTTAELTATDRVGFQKYTFPKSNNAHILFDIGNKLGESGDAQDAYINLKDSTTIEGYVITKPEYVKKYQPEATIKMYFYAKLSKPAKKVHTFYRGKLLTDQTSIKGTGACLAVNFETEENEEVLVRIGQSYTSIDNAKN